MCGNGDTTGSAVLWLRLARLLFMTTSHIISVSPRYFLMIATTAFPTKHVPSCNVPPMRQPGWHRMSPPLGAQTSPAQHWASFVHRDWGAGSILHDVPRHTGSPLSSATSCPPHGALRVGNHQGPAPRGACYTGGLAESNTHGAMRGRVPRCPFRKSLVSFF